MLGVVTPYSVGFTGLFIAVLPIHPLGNPSYMVQATRKFGIASLLSYALGLGCVAYSVYGIIFHHQWAYYFSFPALLYWFIFTEPGKADENMKKYLATSTTKVGNDA